MEQAQTSTKPWRILDVLQWGAGYLTRHGISQPRLSIELLLSKVLQTKRLDLYLQFDKLLSSEDLARLKSLLEKRREHTPVQYLLGEWDFFGLPFWISEHVLIPRPETEIVVESLLNRLQKDDKKGVTYGLDLGTGSGNIAVAMTKQLAECRCVAVDISLDALAQARLNAQRHGVSDRIEFRHGSWFEPLRQSPAGTLDWIVSNPPYVAKEHWDSLPPEVRLYEPRTALWAGENGLDFYRVIVAGSPAHLKPGGWLALEIGDGQARDVQSLVEAQDGLSFVEIVKDHAGTDRVILAQRM